MNEDDLRTRFPRSSEAFIRANLSAGGSGTPAVVESGVGTVALAADKAEERDCSRFLVRVVSVRSRLIDEDNLCEKFHVDLCRYAGALPSDAPGRCRIETSQRKAAKGEAEFTEITVFKL